MYCHGFHGTAMGTFSMVKCCTKVHLNSTVVLVSSTSTAAMIPTAPLRVRAAATVICIRSKESGINAALSLEDPGRGLRGGVSSHGGPPVCGWFISGYQ